jgi:Rho GDP-dissociation inhibitor
VSAVIACPANHFADEHDESLRKYKETLLGAAVTPGNTISDPNDPRKCIIESLGLEVEGREDIIIDLKSPGAVEALEKKPFTIKEGADFRMKVCFKVQHDVLAGLKYVQVVKRMGLSQKQQEMIVSLAHRPLAGKYSRNNTGFIRSEHERQTILREEM